MYYVSALWLLRHMRTHGGVMEERVNRPCKKALRCCRFCFCCGFCCLCCCSYWYCCFCCCHCYICCCCCCCCCFYCRRCCLCWGCYCCCCYCWCRVPFVFQARQRPPAASGRVREHVLLRSEMKQISARGETPSQPSVHEKTTLDKHAKTHTQTHPQ